MKINHRLYYCACVLCEELLFSSQHCSQFECEILSYCGRYVSLLNSRMPRNHIFGVFYAIVVNTTAGNAQMELGRKLKQDSELFMMLTFFGHIFRPQNTQPNEFHVEKYAVAGDQMKNCTANKLIAYPFSVRGIRGKCVYLDANGIGSTLIDHVGNT